MKDHDTDNDFLDDLYLHSAKDVPPTALDQAILKQAHTKAHKGHFLQRLHWQQFFSVAAVMMLSVYLVLDVGDQSMDIEGLSIPRERSRFDNPALNDEQTVSKVNKMMAPAVDESTAVSEVAAGFGKAKTAEMNSYQGTEIIESEDVEAQTSAEGERLMATPEDMIAEIERLIAEGKLAEAKQVYNELSGAYPNDPLPIEILDALK